MRMTLALSALLLVLGCGLQNEDSTDSVVVPVDSTDVAEPLTAQARGGDSTDSSGKPAQASFVINTTEFGIDPDWMTVELDQSTPDSPVITLELAGDESVFDPLDVDDDSEWSFALSPPGFNLREYPATIDPETGIVTAEVDNLEVEDYEFSILMIEHHLLDDVIVRFKPEEFIEIDGTVDLFGENQPFKIRWKK